MNQDVEIDYLKVRRTDLAEAITDLSGMVLTLETKVTDYSMLGEDEEAKTNTRFKERLAKQSRKEQNQKERITELAGRLLSVIDDKIPELKRKDAENQAIYDNRINIEDPTITIES